MAWRADYEGLAPPFGHDLGPCRSWRPGLGEVGKLANLVDVHVGPGLADLASTRPEPSDQLLAPGRDRGEKVIVEGRLLLPLQRNTTEPCHQWSPACSFDDGLEACSPTVWGVDDGLVLARHLRHGRLVLGGQGLEHRGFRVPSKPVQSRDVAGQQVVLDET